MPDYNRPSGVIAFLFLASILAVVGLMVVWSTLLLLILVAAPASILVAALSLSPYVFREWWIRR